MDFTYGEYLFDAKSKDILECLNAISDEDIRDCSDYSVYQRGLEYYQEGMVEDILHQKGNNTVVAEVKGTKKYRIEFYIDENKIYSTCDCPYAGVCKHTIAALLWMVLENTGSISSVDLPSPTTNESLDFLKGYLESLSKADLVQMVMKFAPNNFITEVQNRKVRDIDHEKIFKTVDRKITKFFADDELLFDPGAMEGALMDQLNMLKGLEDRIPYKIGELILYIIRSIENAFNEGYLYVDHYYDDYFFESEAFCEYVIAFVQKLPFDEKTTFILQLDQALNEMSYDTFFGIEKSYPRFFKETEARDLKNYISNHSNLPSSMLSRLYGFLEAELEPGEREAILRIISQENEDQFIILCRLLAGQERYRETFDLIREHLVGRNYLEDSQLILIFLDVAHKLDPEMDGITEEAVQKCPRASILHKIKYLTGAVSPRCENIVREWQPEELLSYLEKEDRMKDALDLVQEPEVLYDEIKFAFFKKNRKIFPVECEAYLKDRIEQNLNHTGKSFYTKVAESLDLMNRVNPERTKLIAEEIRANFKRRTNLMSMIRRY